MPDINDWVDVKELPKQQNTTHSQEMSPMQKLSLLSDISKRDTPEYKKLHEAQTEELVNTMALGSPMKIPGLDKLGDFLMQKAAGVKKYLPGVGTEALKQNIVGSRGMIAKQAEKKLAPIGEKISKEAAKVPSTTTQLDELVKLKQSYVSPEGYIPQESKAIVRSIEQKIANLRAEPAISGSEQLARRKIVGKAAREAGSYKVSPAQTAKSKVLKAEQSARSTALKEGYRKSVPEAPETLANLDKSYSALSTIKDAASKKPDVLSGLIGKTVRYGVAPGLGYGVTGKPEGALAGAALASPAGLSSSAQALRGLEGFFKRGGAQLLAPRPTQTQPLQNIDEINDWQELK